MENKELQMLESYVGHKVPEELREDQAESLERE